MSLDVFLWLFFRTRSVFGCYSSRPLLEFLEPIIFASNFDWRRCGEGITLGTRSLVLHSFWLDSPYSRGKTVKLLSSSFSSTFYPWRWLTSFNISPHFMVKLQVPRSCSSLRWWIWQLRCSSRRPARATRTGSSPWEFTAKPEEVTTVTKFYRYVQWLRSIHVNIFLDYITSLLNHLHASAKLEKLRIAWKNELDLRHCLSENKIIGELKIGKNICCHEKSPYVKSFTKQVLN